MMHGPIDIRFPKIVFMYFLNKEICCILRHAAIPPIYFPQNGVYFIIPPPHPICSKYTFFHKSPAKVLISTPVKKR